MKFQSILEKITPSEIATNNGHWWDSFGRSERETSAKLFVRACQRAGQWAVIKDQLDAEDSSGRYIFNGLVDDNLIQQDGEHYVPSPAFLAIAYGKFPARHEGDAAEVGSKAPYGK